MTEGHEKKKSEEREREKGGNGVLSPSLPTHRGILWGGSTSLLECMEKRPTITCTETTLISAINIYAARQENAIISHVFHFFF